MKNGPYTLIVAPPQFPGMKYRGRYAYEHIVVWWKHHGSLPIKNKSVIHHENGNKTDNRIENLSLITTERHGEEHRSYVFGVIVCAHCMSIKTRSLRRFRKQIKDGREQFCSRECQYESLKKDKFQGGGTDRRSALLMRRTSKVLVGLNPTLGAKLK